jgi:transposase
MEQSVVYRYSLAFKRQVVDDIENGRFDSMEAARIHYGIKGPCTVKKWIRRFGKNHLLAKVIRVEKPDEKDQIRQLRQEVRKLRELLGSKEAEKAISEAYLEIACEELGTDIESFKKKGSGVRLIRPVKKEK